MNLEAFHGMADNAAFLLALVVLYNLLPTLPNSRRLVIRLASGAVLGLIATATMLSPWQLEPGVFFDTRSVLLSVSGLAFETLPTIIAAAIAIGLRLLQGGGGVGMGVGVIVSSAALGIGWRHLRHHHMRGIGWGKMYLFGVLVHVVMLLWTFALPTGLGTRVLGQIAAPVLAIYPAITAVMGMILVREEQRRDSDATVRESEERLRQVVQQIPVMLVAFDSRDRVLAWNQEAQRITGYSAGHMLGKSESTQALLATLKDAHPATDRFEASGPAGELEVVGRDGNHRTIAWADLSAQNPIPGWHRWAVGVDITDRKRAEQELARSNARLQTLREIDGDIMGSHHTDTVVQNILSHMTAVFPCQHCVAAIVSPENARPRLYSCDAPDAPPFPWDQIEPASLLREASSLAAGELLDWPDIQDMGDKSSPLARAFATAGVRACLILPIISPDDRFGALAILAGNACAFDAKHHQFIVEVADLLAIAIHHTGMAEEVARHHDELEMRVRERTAELEATNRELEAYSYSVSHDLRAPLRAIDGFSLILLEDHSDSLDATARSHLSRIRRAAQTMGDLIDDLLRLSRVSTANLNRAPVDLSNLAEDVIAVLRTEHAGRRVDVRIQQDIMREGDGELLRILLDNLLRNAWKFTGREPDACIEFGAMSIDSESVYYVRDNGAGFDMNYVSKLFGPFQRLHRTNEFEGTGIGLAICRRIVQRHGGRIWAEGKLDQGATFYFTIPSSHANDAS